MNYTQKYATREQWLEAAVEKLRPIFKGQGYDIPPVKVSTGWPSRGALSVKKRTLGQCWAKAASEDKETAQIFISPLIPDDGTEWGARSILAHEVVHAVVGNEAHHGKEFRKCGKQIGLTGKPAHMVADKDLLTIFETWDADLGPYPHQKINPQQSGIKKQGTRMLKCVCPECDYTVRVTKKWVDVGMPVCCCGEEMKLEMPSE